MAGVKITELDALATAASDDLLYIVDVSDTSESPQGTSKSIEVGNIGRTYKVYTALLTQNGETAPTAIELENTLGEIQFAYVNEGRYFVQSTNLFTFEKTVIFISPLNNASGEGISVINEDSTSQFNLDTYFLSTNTPSNQLLFNTAIEIRVYN
jgi:hypothetical protein